MKTDAKVLLALRHSSPTVSRRGGGTPGTLTALNDSSYTAETTDTVQCSLAEIPDK